MVACDVWRLFDDRPGRAAIRTWQRQFAIANFLPISRYIFAEPVMAPRCAKGAPR